MSPPGPPIVHLSLEGKVTLARIFPPAPAAISASPAVFVDYFRVRIDPTKSGDTDSFLQFNFSDGTSAGLHIRRAVAEFIAEPDKHSRKPDVTVAMSVETWAKLYLSQVTPEDMVKSTSDKPVRSVFACEGGRDSNAPAGSHVGND